MAFAVNIYFDPETEALLQRYWKALDHANIPNKTQRAFRPHITLCIFDDINCDDCECYINQVSSQLSMHAITLDHIGIFNNGQKVLFLAPAPNEKMLRMHKEIYETLAQYARNPWKLYHPNEWVPHSTLANDLEEEELMRALAIALEIPLPIHTEISQIGIIEFDPIHTIFEVDIKD